MDYFIRLWIRSERNQTQFGMMQETLLDIPNSLISCSVMKPVNISCTTYNQGAALNIPMPTLMSQQWVHFAISGQIATNQSYIRLDYPDLFYGATVTNYFPVISSTTTWQAYLGINSQNRTGFIGQIKEFLFYHGFIAQQQIANIKNQVLLWDLNIISYFRLRAGNMYDEYRYQEADYLFKGVTQVIGTAYQTDNLPNDMCYPFLNYTSVAFQNITNNTAGRYVEEGSLDQRFVIKTQGYQYSCSFWMKTQQGFQTTLNPQVGGKQYYFFSLDQAFSIWFSTYNKVQIYINSIAGTNDVQTQPVFFPINQWANLQFIIDQKLGYEVRVYNFQKQLMANYSLSTVLAPQLPSGKFNIINNFVGFIKSLVVYQNNTGFPVKTLTDMQTSYLNYTLLYYKFDQPRFGFNGLVSSLANHPTYGIGPSVRFKFIPIFDYVQWYEYAPDDGSTTLGTINQNYTLFDGITCNDQNYTYSASGNSSYIAYNLIPFTQPTFYLTVELWFRRNVSMSNPNFLFQLQNVQTNQTFFNIYQDQDMSLKCSPFPLNINSTLTLPGYNYQYLGWQHISCKYSSGLLISAQYDTQDKFQSFAQKDAIFITMFIAKGQYQMIIGNNYIFNMGQNMTFFKEIRLWTTDQSSTQIIKGLYQYVDPATSPNLNTYLQLASGTPDVYNFPGLNGNQNVANISNVFAIPEGTMRVCPLQTYQSQFTTGCFKNPFITQKIHAFADPNSQNELQYTFTTQFSDMRNPAIISQLSSQWVFYNLNQVLGGNLITNVITNNNVVNVIAASNSSSNNLTNIFNMINNTNSSNSSQQIINPISINSTTFNSSLFALSGMGVTINRTQADNLNYYNIQLLSTNQRQLFTQTTSKTFAFQFCRYYADAQTNQSINTVIYRDGRGNSTRVLQFKQFSMNNLLCQFDSLNYQNIQAKVTLDIVPSIYTTLIAQNIIFNVTNGNIYQITIPQSVQLQIPMETYINIIASVTWSNILNSQVIQTQNVAYSIMFAYTAYPIVKYSFSNILYNQNLYLDGTQSYVTLDNNTQTFVGLVFQWTCPQQLQSICSSQINNRFLYITYSQYLSCNASFGQQFNFSLSVWRANNPDGMANATSLIPITWWNVQVPNFQIKINGGKIFSTQSSQIYVDLTNYNTDDPNLVYSWSITPNSIQIMNMSQFSNDQSVMIVPGLVFAANTNYQFQVSIWNQLFPIETIQTKTVNVSTAPLPVAGQTTITPSSGTYLTTTFTIQLSNWVTNNGPLQYMVWAQVTNDEQPFLVSNQWYFANQTFTSTLPVVQTVIVQVTDATQESIYVDLSVQVTIDPSVNLNTIIQAMSAQTNIQTRYIQYSQVAYQLANTDYTNIATNTLQQAGDLLLSYIETDIQNVASNLQTTDPNFQQDVQLFQNAVLIIALVTSNSNILTEQLVNYSQVILNYVQNNAQLYNYSLSNSDFQQYYAQILGNLITYSDNQITFANMPSNRRLLQSSSTNYSSQLQSLLSKASSYADSICSQLATYENKYQIDTTSFSLIVEKFMLNSTVYSRTYTLEDYGGQQMVVPINDIILQTNANYNTNKSALPQYFCTEAFFFTINILNGMSFVNQTEQVPLYMIVETKDSNSYDVINNNFQAVNTSFNQAFLYDFISNSSTFSYNQTVCAYINQSNSYAQTNWTENNCATVYDYKDSMVLCNCQTLGPYIYTVINDYNRYSNKTLQKLSLNQSVGPPPKVTYSRSFLFQGSCLAIIVILVLLIIIFPILAIVWDKNDYMIVKEDASNEQDEVINKFAFHKNLALEQVIYKKKLIEEIKDIQTISCNTMFVVFMRYLHPFFNVIFAFDIELKRLIRYMFFLYKVGILVIIITIIFGNNYRQDNQNLPYREDTGMDDQDKTLAIILGLILGLFTTPFPECMTGCLRTKLVKETPENEQQYSSIDKQHRQEEKPKQQRDSEDDESNVDVSQSNKNKKQKKKNNKNDFEGGSEENEESNERPQTQQRLKAKEEIDRNKKKQNKNNNNNNNPPPSQQRLKQKHKSNKVVDEQNNFYQEELYQPVEIRDSCFYCKLLLLVLCFALFVAAVIYVGVNSANNPKANTLCIVTSWFIAVFVGVFVYNVIRVILISSLASGQYQEFIKREDSDYKDEGSTMRWLFFPGDAVKIVESIYILNKIRGREEFGGEQEDNNQVVDLDEEESDKNRDKKKKKEERENQYREEKANGPQNKNIDKVKNVSNKQEERNSLSNGKNKRNVEDLEQKMKPKGNNKNSDRFQSQSNQQKKPAVRNKDDGEGGGLNFQDLLDDEDNRT